MSLNLRDVPQVRDSFPRVSGDEPVAWSANDTIAQFSPRERG